MNTSRVWARFSEQLHYKCI